MEIGTIYLLFWIHDGKKMSRGVLPVSELDPGVTSPQERCRAKDDVGVTRGK